MAGKAKNMAYISVGAVFIALCSWLTLPGPVPFTMQTFGVFFVLGLLGGKRGSASLLVYVLLGLVGLPVFSGFLGGLAVFMGPTGGYILGFLAAAALYWLITAKNGDSVKTRLCAMFWGLSVSYGLGTAWYVFVFSGAGRGSLGTALFTCVLPFVLPDILKITAAAILSKTVWSRMGKYRP